MGHPSMESTPLSEPWRRRLPRLWDNGAWGGGGGFQGEGLGLVGGGGGLGREKHLWLENTSSPGKKFNGPLHLAPPTFLPWMTASLGIRVIRSSLVDWWSMKKECRHARHNVLFKCDAIFLKMVILEVKKTKIGRKRTNGYSHWV
jgi:hypothetical protein